MTEIHPAQPELLAVAAAMRPGWDQRDLSGALAAAGANGWPWPRAFLAAARLLADPKATPRDLLAEVVGPLERHGTPLTHEQNARRAAEARDLLASGGAP